MKRLQTILVVITVCIISTNLIFVAHGNAAVPYRTLTQDGRMNIIETQTSYIPIEIIDSIDEQRMSNPSDIFLAHDGNLYIADTGNRRILITNRQGKLLGIVGEEVLQKPSGVFVTLNGEIYVADETAEKVYKFSSEGDLIKEFSRPIHPLFGDGSPFKPQKVVVDASGNVYVASLGNFNGIIRLSSDGLFLGYFGANPTIVSLMTIFRRAIFTEAQRARMIQSIPGTVTNISIDNRGLIHVVSQGEGMPALRKLNRAGRNIINPTIYDSFFTDVTTGPFGNIFTVTENGFVFEYSDEGRLLSIFGGSDDGRGRVGLFGAISGIAVDNESILYVLDRTKNRIVIFEPTEFTNLVHEALTLYQKGHYLESKVPWGKVLSMNSQFDIANIGVGEAFFGKGQYGEALNSFRLGEYRSGFNDAFWETRNIWMRRNVDVLLIGIICLYLFIKLLNMINKKYGFLKPVKVFINYFLSSKIIQQMTMVFHILRKPGDTFYDIKREGKAGYLSATILLIIGFAVYVFNRYASGFLFRAVPDGFYDLVGDAYFVFGVAALVITCNYLVTTVNNGEGTFKSIYCGFVYSFAPYILITPIIVILSNFLTFTERFLIDFPRLLATVWTGILLVKMIKEVNDYSLRETVKIILYTVFMVLMAGIVIFILYVLLSQMLDFIFSLYGEAVRRVELQ